MRMRKLSSSNYNNEITFTQDCPITSTMLAIGGRWKLIIIWHLRKNALRYSQLKNSIPNISEKMLIQQLKELQTDGWVVKKNYNEIPPRTDYGLTKLGKSFIPILENIYRWGIKNNITQS
jgi:DNA-binding HxlR family transcriptional regulator